MRDLEAIIVVVNFVPQRSHLSLNLPSSWFRDSATKTLEPAGMTLQPSKLSHRHNRSAHFPEWKKSLKCIGGIITCTPDTTLTIFLLQPFTTTCCDWFDRNDGNIDNTEPPIPTEELIENAMMLAPIKGWAEVNLHDPSLCSLSNHFAVYRTSIKVHHRYPDLSNKHTGFLEAYHRGPQIVQDKQTPGAQTP